jgi:competence ComEA-like helix-hairpin-helix protein
VNAALFLLAAALGLAVCGGAALAEAPVLVAGAQPATGPSALIDLNTASAAELESLPGIGHSRALAILAFREAHSGFHSVSQLLRIKGIGRAMLRKLRPLVTVSGVPQKAQTQMGSRELHRVR